MACLCVADWWCLGMMLRMIWRSWTLLDEWSWGGHCEGVQGLRLLFTRWDERGKDVRLMDWS